MRTNGGRHAECACCFGGRYFGGFTLVELLVVIAIVGVLISLLLPSIQAAREAARRIQCANNLKQIALAAANYESAHGHLPPSALLDEAEKTYGGVAYPVVDHHLGNQYSWAVLLLPYLEQQNLYDRFDLSKPAFQQDENPQAQFVPGYLCPSDEAQDRYFSDPELSEGKLFAKGNYAGYVSPFHVDLQLVFPGALTVIGQPLRSIEDGLTNTIAFSEVRTLDMPSDERGAWVLPWAGASILSFDMHHKCSSGGYYCPEDRYYRADPRSLGLTQTPNAYGGLVKDTLHLCHEGSELQQQSDLQRMPCTKWRWPIGLDSLGTIPPPHAACIPEG